MLHTSFAVLCDFRGYTRVEHRLAFAKTMIAEKDASHCVVVDCGREFFASTPPPHPPVHPCHFDVNIFALGKQIFFFPPSHLNSSSVYHAMRLVQYMKQDRRGHAVVSIIEYANFQMP